jgi:hypothetical protein
VTMLDDDTLASLLSRAGASFDVPPRGRDDIVARALGRPSADEGAELDQHEDGPDQEAPDGIEASRRLRRVTALAGRHRLLSVAACIVVLVLMAGAVGALVRSPARSTIAAGPVHASVKAPTIAPSTPTPTTTPAFSSNSRAPQDKTSAPLGASSAAAGTAAPQNGQPVPKGAVGQAAKIEQTGSLTLTVGHGKLGQTITRLTALAGAYGGFVANSQTQSGAAPSGSVTLQVPVKSFTTVLTRAEALGRASALSTKATDVTGQYVDLQSRLTALQASRQQYLTILAKATSVGDVLAVQEQIDSVESQIEQLQGQLQLLANQTSYSTLTVTVSESTPAKPPGPLPESGLVEAWHSSIGGFVTGVEGVIRVAGPLLFALLLLGAIVAGGRALWRRAQRHNL